MLVHLCIYVQSLTTSATWQLSPFEKWKMTQNHRHCSTLKPKIWKKSNPLICLNKKLLQGIFSILNLNLDSVLGQRCVFKGHWPSFCSYLRWFSAYIHKTAIFEYSQIFQKIFCCSQKRPHFISMDNRLNSFLLLQNRITNSCTSVYNGEVGNRAMFRHL